MKKHLIYLLVLTALFFACEQKDEHIQFYHWKQSLELDSARNILVDTLGTQKLYIKYFDVDYTSPTAKLDIESLPSQDIEIIPCVFITNRTFISNSDGEIALLAEKVHKLITDISSIHKIRYSEVQFDCDWTESTRYAFFTFLEKYKALEKTTTSISSTLRLHQLKYPDIMGVPPVDRVALMCYNVGDLKDINESNSIFKPSEIQKYIPTKNTYPLPIDIAMPIYSWAVTYRFGALQWINNSITSKDLLENENIIQLEENRFQVLENHYFEGNYYYKDDILRYEDIPLDSLKAAIDIIAPLKGEESQLILFDLSSKNTLNYDYEDIQDIGHRFY